MDDPLSPGGAGELHVYEDLEALSRAAAERLARRIEASVASRGRCTLVLAGGGTPGPLYGVRASEYAERIPWSRLHVFWGDERYVPHDDPRSNYGMARGTLLDHVPLPPENIHPIPTHYPDPKEAAQAYEKTLLASLCGPPRFDIILLGIGDDGHTASLFPGSPALEEGERLVVATRAPAEPRQRISLTFPALNAAREVHFLCAGPGKAEPVRCARAPEPAPERCPASSVRPLRGMLAWWLDRDAARLVGST
jgi:6-phosphogluconolactonase